MKKTTNGNPMKKMEPRKAMAMGKMGAVKKAYGLAKKGKK